MEKIMKLKSVLLWGMFVLLISFGSCEDPGEENIDDDDTTKVDTTDTDTTDHGNGEPFSIDNLSDTYYDLAPIENVNQWGPYNVHDPSVIKVGDTYYCYNTDVAYGTAVRPGIQVRKSKDLVEWEFVGWVFSGIPTKGRNFITSNGGEPNDGLWAPYIMEYQGEYRLYYSLSSPTPRLSVIGLATSDSPEGPWVERDLVVTSLDNNVVQTNAIDPSIVIDQSGEHWFYYGSAWDGIYILKLDPETGLAAVKGDKGKRIAQRGFTGNDINGNIEGPEIIYNPEFDKYYLFIAYDWLETKYNVRVGMADSPEGPFYDFLGFDMNEERDDVPMILAPYRFDGHSGWQGVSHPAVFSDGAGQYYMAHQGRPGVDPFFMVLHIRKIFWTEDGWPIVSPQRYAGIEQSPVGDSDLAGNWEQIVLGYTVVPGYAEEQIFPNFQNSVDLTLDEAGTINGDENNLWTFDDPWLELSWNGTYVDKVYVEWGRDWENKVDTTLIFTGLNNEGTAIWGKKVE